MSRKGSKNLSESERKLILSIMNDYEVCALPDKKMIEILSQKLGRDMKDTSYYALKSEAKKNRQTSEQWLDNFCKYGGLVEFYKQRFDESSFIQKELLKLYADEATKKDTVTKQNRVLMAKLAKTISDNSKNLSELGMSPVILAKLQSLIPHELLLKGDPSYVENHFRNMDDNKRILWAGKLDGNNKDNDTKEKENRLDPSKIPTAILPPIDEVSSINIKSSKESSIENDADQDDQRVF
ncbi:MAG: hypothetical protein L0H53_14490 [Candidatus Nitrosocosmicus sp.]|nr:hypothetical protein [Candidatus Nitrosocosmicus sp.]MDN5868568.1 hypothetical protein [Candidatus Nitrosocosmicus sp.]